MASINRYTAVVPDDPEAFYIRGKIQQQMAPDEPRKAEPYFQKAIELKPDFAEAHLALGMVAYKAGEWQLAVNHFKIGLSTASRKQRKIILPEIYAAMFTKDIDLMIKLFVLAIAVVTVALLDGCASLWQQVEGRSEAAHCSIQMPEGWMRLSSDAYQLVSKDGPYLQYILLNEQPVTQGFQYTRRKIQADMLPNELAEVVISNLQGDPCVGQLRIIANEPAMVCGAEGFRLMFTY